MSAKASLAEQLLLDLGISHPEHIDLERIARSQGAKIRYRMLNGCEARIVGEKDRAIISIDERVPERRQRFSIGHELGHWMCHRGQCLACQKMDIGRGGVGTKPKEKVADRYAADLLMPRFLLREVVRQRPGLDLGMIEDVVEVFGVSRTAAALRLVETEVEPCILIRHSRVEQPWRIPSPSVDRRWTPRMRVDPGTHAHDILHARAGDQLSAELVSAEDWFTNDGADQYEILEQSFRSLEGEVLTLIVIKDEAMLAD
jgi:Zn-dependent peptidase ImmA (M78 family)